MENQVLSIEQMKHLVKLGSDTSKASMCWIKNSFDGEYNYILTVHNEWCYEMSHSDPIPTFTLQNILELLPNIIANCYLCIYEAEYMSYERIDSDGDVCLLIEKKGETILDSAYQMLVWVVENNHFKNNSHERF